ncbi:MAG: diacylglycerol kinase family protein [Candidatus Andersenbacteria bacterium]
MKEWHKSRTFSEAFSYAWSGLTYVVLNEENVRRQIFLGFVTFFLAFLLKVPVSHVLILILATVLIIVLEMLNTVLELLQDLVHPEYHPSIKLTKDIAAAVVLVASLGALVIGLIIFLPPLIRLLGVVA